MAWDSGGIVARPLRWERDGRVIAGAAVDASSTTRVVRAGASPP